MPPRAEKPPSSPQAIRHAVEDEGWRAPIPDEAFDLHTAEGRAEIPDKNTRLRNWLNVASRAIGDTGPVDWVLWIRGGRFVVERSTVPRSKQKPNSGTPRVA